MLKRRILLATGWILTNLILALLIIPLFPANFLRFVISFFGPAITAIIFCYVAREPLGKILKLRKSNLKYIFFAVSFPIVVAIITGAISIFSGFANFQTSHNLAFANTFFSLLLWICLAFGEEIGWRGFLQSHLAFTKHAPLIIGIIWATWHFHTVLRIYPDKKYMIGVFTGAAILVSYFFSWLTAQSESVIPAAISHGVWNALNFKIIFGDPDRGTSGLLESADLSFANMEGFAGLIALILICGIFVRKWYQNSIVDPMN